MCWAFIAAFPSLPLVLSWYYSSTRSVFLSLPLRPFFASLLSILFILALVIFLSQIFTLKKTSFFVRAEYWQTKKKHKRMPQCRIQAKWIITPRHRCTGYFFCWHPPLFWQAEVCTCCSAAVLSHRTVHQTGPPLIGVYWFYHHWFHKIGND